MSLLPAGSRIARATEDLELLPAIELAVWRLLTDHATELSWLPASGGVAREPDIAGRELWTYTSSDGVWQNLAARRG